MDYVYVLAIDHGYEGHTPPIQAFVTEADARAGLALAKAGPYGYWKLYKVPVWPTAPAGQYWEIEPVRLDSHGQQAPSGEPR